MVGPGDKLRLLERIGEGGTASVYRALWGSEAGLEREVAVKVLDVGAEAYKESLFEEARALVRVRHPAAVRVFGHTELDGRSALVMELLTGCDLDRLSRRVSVPPGISVQIVASLASVLDDLHDPRVEDRREPLVHLDLKPANVVLSRYGRVRLLDFGAARPPRRAEQDDLIEGTPAYLAPERLDGREEGAADVYSLGCLLYELLRGRRLALGFHGAARHEDRVEGRLRQVHSALRPLLREMLTWDPDRRPSAADVLVACESLIAARGVPSLEAWARAHAVQASHGTLPGPLTGRLVSQPRSAPVRAARSGQQRAARSGQQRAAPRLPSRPPRRWWRAIAAVGLCLAPALLGGFAAAEVPHAPPETQLRELPTAQEVLVALQRPRSTSRRSPAPAPAPEDPAPTEQLVPLEEPAPAPRGARLQVTGDASKVTLHRGAQARGPGHLSAGTWTVRATFPGRGTLPAGTIELADGEHRTLHCQARFARCDLR